MAPRHREKRIFLSRSRVPEMAKNRNLAKSHFSKFANTEMLLDLAEQMQCFVHRDISRRKKCIKKGELATVPSPSSIRQRADGDRSPQTLR